MIFIVDELTPRPLRPVMSIRLLPIEEKLLPRLPSMLPPMALLLDATELLGKNCDNMSAASVASADSRYTTVHSGLNGIDCCSSSSRSSRRSSCASSRDDRISSSPYTMMSTSPKVRDCRSCRRPPDEARGSSDCVGYGDLTGINRSAGWVENSDSPRLDAVAAGRAARQRLSEIMLRDDGNARCDSGASTGSLPCR